jgi:toxin ParE1/3/4
VRRGLHPEARAELRAAAVWYDDQRPGLGDKFLAEVTSVLEAIASAPQSWPLWPGISKGRAPIRRAVLGRFPYVIAYEVQENRVYVLAVAHAKRRPLYWLARRAREPG